MSRILHHLRKDAREWRWLVAGWVCLLLLQAVVSWTRGSGFFQFFGLLPAVSFLFPLFAVAIIVQSDAVAGSRSFWMTRPLREREILAAKAIFIAAAFIVLPIAVDLILFLAYGLRTDAFLVIPEFAIDRLWVVGVGFVAGACTATFPRACLFMAVGFGIFLATMVVFESVSEHLGRDQRQHVYLPVALFAGAIITVLLQYFLRPSPVAVRFGAGFLIAAPFLGHLLPMFPDPGAFVQRDVTGTEIGMPGLKLVQENGVLYRNFNQEPDPEYSFNEGPVVGLGAKCVVEGLPPMHSIGVVKSELKVTFEGADRQVTFSDSPRGLLTSRSQRGSAVGVPKAVSSVFAGEDTGPLPWPDAKDALPTLLARAPLHTMEQWKDRSAAVVGEATIDLFRHRVIGTVPLKPGAAWRDGATRYQLGQIGSHSVSVRQTRPNLRPLWLTRLDRGRGTAPRTLAQAPLHAIVTPPATSGDAKSARVLMADLMPRFAAVGQGAFISANSGFHFDRNEDLDLTRPDMDYHVTFVRREYVATLTIPIEIGDVGAADLADSALTR